MTTRQASTALESASTPVSANADLVAQLVAYIQAAQLSSNGWSVGPKRAPDIESTAWVLIGASRVPTLSHFAAPALAALLTQQADDGSWSYRTDLTGANWPTLPAVLALSMAAGELSTAEGLPATVSTGALVERATRARDRAAQWMLAEHSATPSWWALFLSRMERNSATDSEVAVVLDATLDGYGWAEDTFAWVEPTALAAIAFSRLPATDERNDRQQTCVRLLMDRQAPDGGWNYGNKRVLGYDLASFPDTSAWALLGLLAGRRFNREDSSAVAASARRGMHYLRASVGPHASVLSLALTRLAHTALRANQAMRTDSATVNDADIGDEPVSVPVLTQSTTAALEYSQLGYPLLDTRTAVLVLLSLHDVNVLAGPS